MNKKRILITYKLLVFTDTEYITFIVNYEKWVISGPPFINWIKEGLPHY